MKAKGTVFKYGDNIDTDVIIPARYLNTSDPKELASHYMEDIDTEFIKKVKQGDIMVGEKNFGCGSSREHADVYKRQILTCHEQHAAHAADGYARATGKPGVVFATSGPGATNLVTGIATAYMDSVPMVAITGNVEKKNLGKDSFQEIDITGVTIPITKHNVLSLIHI